MEIHIQNLILMTALKTIRLGFWKKGVLRKLKASNHQVIISLAEEDAKLINHD